MNTIWKAVRDEGSLTASRTPNSVTISISAIAPDGSEHGMAFVLDPSHAMRLAIFLAGIEPLRHDPLFDGPRNTDDDPTDPSFVSSKKPETD